MTTFNTGNSVPSANAKDRFDNSQTFDEFVAGSYDTTVTRTGKTLLTLRGMNNQFNQWLTVSGFEMPAIPYAAGAVINRASQLISYQGEQYSVAVGSTFPYTLNGTFSVDAPNLVQRSEQSLRSDLGNVSNPILGAAMVARAVVSVGSLLDLRTAKQDPSQKYLVTSFYAGGSTGGDWFYWSPSTPKSRHNGWRVIDPAIPWDGTPATLAAYLNAVGGAGNGCFIRESFDGRQAIPEMAGALTDWNGSTGTDATESIRALIKDPTVTRVSGSGGTYWVGNFAANEQRFLITRPIVFDWNWSTFKCRCEGSALDVSSSLFFHEDVSTDIGGHIMDDIGYSYAIAGRGIQAVTIVSRTKSTRGHTVGPCYIARGQSIITSAPMASNSLRVSNIRFRGAVTYGAIYYGVNLADNGDDFQGTCSGYSVIRAAFVYGVSDVNLFVKAARTIAASASVLISQNAGSRPTERVTIKAQFGEINGPVLISTDPSTSGSGVFRDLDISVAYDVLGGNLDPSVPVVKMGCYGPGDVLLTETQTVTTDNIRLSLTPGPGNVLLTQPIIIYTPSPNHGRWILEDNFPWEPFGVSPANAAGVFNTPTLVVGGRILKSVTGNLSLANAKVRIPAKYFLSRRANQEITTVLRIAARNGVGGNSALRIEEKAILAQVDSFGSITLGSQSSIFAQGSGTPAATFTLAVSSDFKFIEVTCSGFTGGSGALTVSFQKP